MPEFYMNIEGARDEWDALPDFLRGFIEAAFFTETSQIPMADWFTEESQEDVREGRADGCLPSDAGMIELHPDALKEMAEFCAAFQAKAAPLLAKAYARDYDEAQAGRDLWFTYNGHGVGFWDRDALSDDGLGDALSESCGRGEFNLWFADHVTYGSAPFIHASHY